MTVPLYLASTSPARLALLRAAGVEPVLISPGVDEEAAVARAEEAAGRVLTASETVSLLARAKAEAVLDVTVDGRPLDGLVLGGDSAFEFDGEVHGKPHEPALALDRWRRMAEVGRGTLWSGHWLIDHRGGSPRADASFPSGGAGAVASADLVFADDLEPEELAAYVETGEPLEVAGAFTIDGRASAFITHIEGTPSAVVGLSVPVLRSLVRGFGVSWPELWTTPTSGAL
ncbi:MULTISPECIES: Maf family protein [unclassified Frigoribacterium]|uniref:Maf family protein n=1 Tax=unclassified Frigoribacterium TaxID=2627005 RepID=UPI000F4AF2F5|nr:MULTISPECIES: Maf family protein [unclassified Frigoribacterium]ROP78250.1 septum formation protein [Frigoribacterium sp. PhB107]TDT66097.1 septum formation protein [Frigoribacterium sp. PhB116]